MLALCAVLPLAAMQPLAAHAQPAQAQPVPAAASDAASEAALMPASIANVVLGMAQADLQRARPAAQAAFSGDSVGYPKLLFEKLRSDFASQAIYLFDDAKPVLAGVVLLGTGAESGMARTLPAFRNGVVKRWGMPDSIARGRGESGAREVALVWRRGGTVVVASYPDDPRAARAATTVRISKAGSAADAYTGKLEAMDKAAQARLMDELKNQLRASPTALPFN